MKSLILAVAALGIGVVVGRMLPSDNPANETNGNGGTVAVTPIGKIPEAAGSVTGDSQPSSEESDEGDETWNESSAVETFREMLIKSQEDKNNFNFREMMTVGNLIFSMNEAEVIEAIEILTDETQTANVQTQWMYLSSVFARFGEIDPVRALDVAQELNGQMKNMASNGAISSWATTDTDGALAHIQSMENGQTKTQLLSTVISTMAQRDPMAAVEYATKLEGQSRQNSFSMIGWAWGSNDPEAAMAYSEAMEDPFTQKQLHQSIINGWAQNDPEGAADYLIENPPEGEGHMGLSNVFSNWLQNDPAAAVEYIGEMSEEERPENFFQGMSWALGNLDDTSVERLGAMISEEKELGQFYSGVASSRVSSGSPEKAVSYLEKIPAEDERSNGYRNVASNWARIDPYQSSEWLDTLPEGKERDSAINGFANQVVGLSPESALKWAESMTDEKQRQNTVRNLANRWKTKNKEEALSYINQSDILTEEQKENLRK